VSPASTSIVVIALVVVWTTTHRVMRGADIRALTDAQRRMLTMAAGVSAALLAWTVWSRPQPQPSDLAPVWAAARAFLHGENPYEAIRPGTPYYIGFRLLYPLTAVVVLLPLALAPLRWADPIFVGLGFALFTWAITAEKRLTPSIVALVSLPALMTLQTSQWSLLLTGAALVPWLGFLLVAKPTIGLALFAAYPDRRSAAACAALVAAATLLAPGWINDWRASFAGAPHIVAPIVRPGGLLILLAALKWRRPEARLLVALGCVPHTTAPYETIPLFLVAESWLQAFAIWALALGAYLMQRAMGPYASQEAYWASGAQWIVLLMYLPCVALVLRRPNVWRGDERQPIDQRTQSGALTPAGRSIVSVESYSDATPARAR